MKHTLPGMGHVPLQEGTRWGPGLAYPIPAHPLMPDSAASSGQHTRYVQPGQVPKGTATSASKDQATGVIFIERGDLPVKVPTKYLSF